MCISLRFTFTAHLREQTRQGTPTPPPLPSTHLPRFLSDGEVSFVFFPSQSLNLQCVTHMVWALAHSPSVTHGEGRLASNAPVEGHLGGFCPFPLTRTQRGTPSNPGAATFLLCPLHTQQDRSRWGLWSLCRLPRPAGPRGSGPRCPAGSALRLRATGSRGRLRTPVQGCTPWAL